jgi:excisionase family DNA binding protein
LIGLKRSAVYNLIASGDLPIVKFGRRTLVTFSALERLLADRERAFDNSRPTQAHPG